MVRNAIFEWNNHLTELRERKNVKKIDFKNEP